MLLRLLGVGLAYGFGFMFVKSLFPEPFVLLIMQGGGSSEGDLTTLALVYMGVGLLAGLLAAPIFGGALLLRRGSGEDGRSGSRLILSLAMALLTGTISGVLTLLVYAYGILPPGGVLDPLQLVRNSVHSAPGVGLLIAWTIARDLLPAGLAGLFLSPLIGGTLQRIYEAGRPPQQRTYDQYDY
ncbi:MAG: hypothetical protein H0X19_15060 [Rubrobacter sp.]|nr:hypothetical protein [Rubrobacter sp.]